MRLDLFLKNSGLVKRRAVAKEMCENRRVLINHRDAKPAREVASGDIITLTYSSRVLELEIIAMPAGPGKKASLQDLYKVKSDVRIQKSDQWNEDRSSS